GTAGSSVPSASKMQRERPRENGRAASSRSTRGNLRTSPGSPDPPRASPRRAARWPSEERTVPDGRQRSPVDRYTDGVDLLRSEEVEAADWRVELAEPLDRERRCERLFLKVKFSRPTANRRKMSSATVLRLAPLFASSHALSPSPRVSRKASRTLPKSFV